jgi:plastocyanin
MRRLAIGVAVGAVLVVAPAIPATASGGGGCGQPVTAGTGTEVAIRMFCFEPTVLTVQEGGAVTFTNEDTFAHNVLGANATWGSFARLGADRARTYSFDEPGVYPYVCAWHPGMVGAVVVGEDAGEVSIGAETVSRQTAGGYRRPDTTGWKVATTVAGGLLLLVVVGTAGLRRRVRDEDRA